MRGNEVVPSRWASDTVHVAGQERQGEGGGWPEDQGLAPQPSRRTGLTSIAEEINPQVRGWISYYGAFYRSTLCSLVLRIDQHLVRWAMQEFKRLRGKPLRAW